jgi:hypothetical protein
VALVPKLMDVAVAGLFGVGIFAMYMHVSRVEERVEELEGQMARLSAAPPTPPREATRVCLSRARPASRTIHGGEEEDEEEDEGCGDEGGETSLAGERSDDCDPVPEAPAPASDAPPVHRGEDEDEEEEEPPASVSVSADPASSRGQRKKASRK